MAVSQSLVAELRSLAGDDAVLPGDESAYLADATETRGVREGRADAVVLPGGAEEVARVVAWCYEHGVPIVPRGGGTGYAAGCVPFDGGVVLALERMRRVRRLDPELWRIEVEAGLTTAELQRRARESGLFFAVDPGAAEQSQIGGNIATNAGGPHAFKYGVTGAWVTGLEAVVPPGEVISLGGPIRKDVAGYDLKRLLIGSEGTLAVITAAWLRLVPAPEAALPVAAVYGTTDAGCDAVERVLGSGLEPATLEYLDEAALAIAGAAFPAELPDGGGFLLVCEADGSEAEAARLHDELVEVLGENALAVTSFAEPARGRDLWRWRDGVGPAVVARRGGKVSEDVAVPLDRLREAIVGTREIGSRYGLDACSWGHAGDGNLHSTFLVDLASDDDHRRAERARDDLFDLAVSLGGTISGEHGIGWTKRGRLERQWPDAAVRLHHEVKRVFDPKGLLNPGKKI